MKCPTCNNECIVPSEKILDELFNIYNACNLCPPDPMYNKRVVFTEKITKDTKRCKKCNKRHLDIVVGHVFSILKEKKLLSENSTLRDVGTPLIVFGYQIPFPPRLGDKSLILIMDNITKEYAQEIIETVPEIKGIIKRKGTQSQSIGILDTNTTPHTYELLAGCDMRCDIVSSLFGELCIYKAQSKIHIEFNNTKVKKMEELYLKGELDNTYVIDGFCGPGTLGLLSLLGGAKKVILNDAWLPAIENTILNLKANSKILGINLEFELNEKPASFIGDEPLLVASSKRFSVYHGDIRKLHKVVKNCDLCIIDIFPNVNPHEYISICKNIAKKVIII